MPKPGKAATTSVSETSGPASTDTPTIAWSAESVVERDATMFNVLLSDGASVPSANFTAAWQTGKWVALAKTPETALVAEDALDMARTPPRVCPAAAARFCALARASDIRSAGLQVCEA